MPRARKSAKMVLSSQPTKELETEHGAEPNSNQATTTEQLNELLSARTSKSPDPRGFISKFPVKRPHALVEPEESDDSVDMEESEEDEEDSPIPVTKASMRAEQVVKKKLSDKKVPTFDGTSDVDDYVDDAKFYVRNNAEESQLDLLEWLLTGLSGIARIAVRSHRKTLRTPAQLFAILIKECRPTGTEQAQLENIIQKSDESITIFSARIKQQLERMECSAKVYMESYISQLTKGSLPDISALLEQQIPASVDDAYRMAKFLEEKVKIEKFNSKRGKPKPSQSNDAKLNVLMNQEKLANDKYEALNDKVGALVNVIQSLTDRTATVDRNQQEPCCNNISNYNNNSNRNNNHGFNNNNGYNNNSNNRNNSRNFGMNNRSGVNNSKSPRMKCFSCGRQGHSYMNCFNATSEQKLAIRDKLQNNEHVKAPESNHLNSNVASSNPRMMQQ